MMTRHTCLMSPTGLFLLLYPNLFQKLCDLKIPVVFSLLRELVFWEGQKGGARCHVSLTLEDEEGPSYVGLCA